MTKRNPILVLFSTLFITLAVSCATIPGIPGAISESSSEFDGTKQIKMEPAWLYNSMIKLALFKNSKMDEKNVVLTVVVKGTHSFSREDSLYFNVDGDIVSFKSMDLLTDINTSEGFVGSGIYIPPSNWSSKDYLVTRDLIKRLVNAERVVIKVELRKSYVEGIFSRDGYTLARPAFREFYQKMETLKMIR